VALEVKVEHNALNHDGHEGERMVTMPIGGQSEFNVLEVPNNTQMYV
jgi:hypothetical protein